MTVNLSTLLFRVRASVAEISVDNMDDLTMYLEVVKAGKMVDQIKKATVTDADLETPIVCLAAYYCHVNYTLLNIRQHTIDETVLLRQNELKKIARAMLHTITDQEIDNNLQVDDRRYEKVRGVKVITTTGCLSETRF